MSNRSTRVAIAQETLAICDRGSYEVGGREVSIADSFESALAGTVLHEPEELDRLRARRVGVADAPGSDQPVIDVRNCTTFTGAAALLDEDPRVEPLCLNFASAKNPGGGFLSGAQAQEEALARGSGLYPCLLTKPEYYDRNAAHRSLLYTDHMIYSPSVPVFRDDDDRLLPSPFATAILTAPAPNAGAVRQNRPDEIDDIEPTMRRRIANVLTVAADRGHERLVLGAWGCGVFGNDPALVARLFREELSSPPFAGTLSRVLFAVLDFSPSLHTFGPFDEIFA